MTAQALYRKWRPRTFDELVGQRHVVRTLHNALIAGRVHHAYLFAGPRGTGKTTTARLLAKAVNCLSPEEERPCDHCDMCVAINAGRLLDLIEIDAASHTGVDDVRELRERVSFRPNEARYKVYVIDEAHMLSNAAGNALLKTLEEPPGHAIFVLATTLPHKIPGTVISRCQRFDFHRISISDMIDRLSWLAEQESIEAEPEALALIARQATGSMRDAESLLDQLTSYNRDQLSVDDIQAALGIGADETVMEITQALADADVAKGLGIINAAVDHGTDPRQLARQVVEHLRSLLLLRLESGVVLAYIPDAHLPSMKHQAAAFSRRELATSVRLFNRAAQEAKGGWQPQLPLEMAFIEALLPAEPEGDEGRGSSSGGSEGRTSGNPRGRREKRRPASNEAAPGTRDQGREVESAQPVEASERPVGGDVVRDAATTYDAAEVGNGPSDAEDVRRHWSAILDALRPKDLSLEALMRSCEPVGLEDDVVVLSFAHKFHLSKVEEDKKRHIVEDALTELFGRPLRVRCVMSRKGQLSPVPVQDGRQRGGDRRGSPEEEAPTDPLVRMAVDELGAEVVQGRA